MKIKVLFFSFLAGTTLIFSQQQTNIALNYDTSGYLENTPTANSQTQGINNFPSDNSLIPTVNAEMNVNESGALTYMLPIEIVKGVNNFQPNISLAYNSQSGNGQAGWGWNIVGLSTINQGGKSKDIDGQTIGPQFNNSDPYYFDGQRLIKISETTFVTEKFSKLKITKPTSGEFSFIVQYTDGRIAKYKELLSGQNYISTYIDAFNNEIHYTYQVNNNTPILTKISYGGTTTDTDKFYINFIYKDRKYEVKIFRNAKEYINNKLLYEINTGSTYGALFRKYTFSHDFIEGNSVERLRTITVENESGEKLKPLNFSYNQSTSGQVKISTTYNKGLELFTVGNYNNIIPTKPLATGLGSVAVGNFDGKSNIGAIYQVRYADGSYKLKNSKGDLIDIFENNSSTEFFSGKTLDNEKNITDNDHLITVKVNYLGTGNTQDPYSPDNNQLQDEVLFIIKDFISGMQRVVKVNLKGSLLERENYHPTDSYDDPNSISNNTSSLLTYSRDKTKRDYISGDFNNDGLIDFLILEKKSFNRGNRIYLVEVGKAYNGTSITSVVPTILSETLDLSDKDFFPLEFDGDGLPELLLLDKTSKSYCVYKIDFTNNSFNKILQDQSLSNFGSDTPLFFGDFNGDGLTDFLTPQKVYSLSSENDNTWELGSVYYNMEHDALLWWKYTSNGKQFIKVQEDYTQQKIAYLKPAQNNIIKRSTFWQKFWNGKPDEYDYTRYTTHNIIISDFNGDGRSDIITLNKLGQAKYRADGRIGGTGIENLGNNFSTKLNFKCSTPTFPSQYIYVVNSNECKAPYTVVSAVTNNIIPLIANFNSNISNKINFYENKSLKGGTFDLAVSQSIEGEKISPLSLILSNTDFNQLNTYKSGIFIHDPIVHTNKEILVNNDSFLEKQIQQVDNGSSVIQKVEFRNMSPTKDTKESTYIFKPQYALQYPYYVHNTNGTYYLVNKIHTLFDGKVLTKEYRFENGIQHLEGKGFLGFQKTYVSDAYESELYNGYYRIKNPFKAVFWNIQTRDPQMENSIIKSSYGGLKKFFTENVVTNKKFDRGNHQYLILATDEYSTDNLKKIKISKKYVYDEANDLKLTTAYTDYGGSGTSISKYTYKPEFSNGDHYFYGKISSTENATYKDGLSYILKEENDYDSVSGSVSQNRKFSNQPNAPPIVTDFNYDNSTGNILTQTLSTVGVISQTTSYQYDTTKRFVVKTTTPDGLFSTSAVDYLGRVSSEVSSLGLTTSYTYDSWGNISTITDFLGKVTTISKSTENLPTGGVYNLSKKREGGVESIVTFDKLDREIQSKSQSLNNKWIVTRTEYDIFGRKTRYTEPFFEGETPKWNSIEYDELNRPIKNTAFTGKVITTCYEGMKVTVDDGYKKTSKTLDAMGNTVRVQDHGGVIAYYYYPNGSLKETDYEGSKTTFEIDGWGNKTKIVDPSAGTFTYEYDNLSRVTRENTPKGYTLYTYDDLGRPYTEKTYGNTPAENTNIEKTYLYNGQTKLPEKITGSSNGKQFIYTTFYDQYFRIKGKKEETPEFTYTSSTTFDSYGRADVVSISTTLLNSSYTSSSSVKNVYDSNGILIQQNDNETGGKIWHVSDINSQGQTTQLEYGNGYNITNTYSQTDLSLQKIFHQSSNGSVALDVDYNYDVNKGVLNWRRNNNFSKKEDFFYDNLNRLTTEYTNGTKTNEYTFDNRGRITSNTELGKYNYNPTDYKLQNLAFNTNGQTVNSQRGFATITYNAFKSPQRITLVGKDDSVFDYNILKSRYSMVSNVTGKQKFYSSDFAVEITKETNGKTQIITYITGDPYSANYIKKEVLSNGLLTEKANYYLHRDNLGSILAITKTDGAIVEKRFFDAWGNLKGLVNSAGQMITNAQQLANATLFLDRGYTGHEHLWKLGLINMNARIYDPVLRRFLSPDNYVQDPYNTQSYNRFGYVFNNPLLYTDPSGNLGFLAVVLIGMAVGIMANGIANMINGIPFWYGMGKAGVMGAVSGAISFGIGSLATSTFGTLVTVGKALYEAGLHAISSGFMSALQGEKFGAAMLSGAISSLIASSVNALGIKYSASRDAGPDKVVYNNFGKEMMKATMIVAGGFSGGISASIAGGNFWQGFRQGLITSGLNGVAHVVAGKIESNDKLNEALKKAGLKRDSPVTKETLAKLATAFKELWGQSSQWAKWADDESIAEWESNDGSNLKIGSDFKIYVKGKSETSWSTKGAWGVTNSIGEMIFAPDLMTNYNPYSKAERLADVFLHEICHSIDSMNKVIGITPYDIGHDLREIKAYEFAKSWTGLDNSNVNYFYQNFIGKMFLLLKFP